MDLGNGSEAGTSGRPASRRAPRAAERGSIQIAVAAGLLVVVFSSAMIVDTGRLAFARRELQLQVDMAALAASREIGGCTQAASDPTAVASTVAASNGFVADEDAASMVVEIGNVSVDPSSGLREFELGASLSEADAVRVTAGRTVPGSLLAGGLLPGLRRLEASAIARSRAEASLRVGSFLVRLDAASLPLANAVLGRLIDGNLTLDLVSYQGLAASRIRLGDLVNASMSLGDLEDLETEPIELSDLFDGIRLALLASPDPDPDAADTVGVLAAAAGAGRSVVVGDFLSVSEDSEAAMDAVIDAFALVVSAAQASAVSEAIEIDPLAISVPDVAGVRLLMAIIEPARMSIGPPGADLEGEWRTVIETAQIRLQLDFALSAGLPVVGGGAVGMSLYFDAARTEARLEGVRCATASDPVDRIEIAAQPGVFRFGMGAFVDPVVSATASPVLLAEVEVLGVPVVRVSGWSTAGLQDGFASLEFDGPFAPLDEALPGGQTQTVDTDLPDAVDAFVQSIGDSYSLDVEVLGFLPIGLSESAVTTALIAMIEPVLVAAAAPALALLDICGLHAGGADLSVQGLFVERSRLVR